MTIPKLKICGMKFPENIMEIAALNPDYLGFIFWEHSTRYMNFDSIPELDSKIKKVGVFVDATVYEIVEKVKKFQLDFVQLHGNETVAFCKELKMHDIKIIKAFSIDNLFDFSTLKPFLADVDYFLFDTKGKLPGGNGNTFDWKILENYPYQNSFFLSGGIGNTEIDALVEFLKTDVAKNCIAIDINSRFETKPGYKSKNKINKFKKSLYEI